MGRKIRTKTQFLTQDNSRIDQISRRIKGFSFQEFEDDLWHSRIDFSMFSHRNLTFKHSINAEIDIEAKGIKRFKDCGV